MLDIIIKNTKTVSEFKEQRKKMEYLTKIYSEKHKSAVENWENGEPKKVWYDINKNFCIEYENGKWWKYNEKGEWW